MKKLNKVAMMFAVAALATAAGAQTRVTAANGGPTIDNWQNGTGELVWKNGTNELCWRDANWTPATAAAGCDGALVPAAPAAAVAPTPGAPAAPPAPPSRCFEGYLRC
jgi:OOP family OmpA-OmpF porin